MATFNNQATLTFGGRTTNSNVIEGEVVTRVTMSKTAVTTDYGPGDGIIYAITLVNTDNVARNGITITDNLGRFTPTGGLDVVPLTYVDESILYYQNGVLQTTPTVNDGPPLIISGISVPANGNVIILYEARSNEYAPQGENAVIRNTATVEGNDICEQLTDTAEVPTRNEPVLSIAKAICPDTVSCGDEVTYTFIIQNTGNTAVVATDNLIVSDTFNPILADITVALNGEILVAGTGYTYDSTTGAFTTLPGAIPVPAASFVRDPETGIVTTTPGVAVITITGRI